MSEKLLSVKQTAILTGITVRTLHYYDEIGLLNPSEKTESGYRLYSNDDLKILQQILFLKEVGFNLNQIKDLVGIDEEGKRVALIKQREILRLKVDRVNELVSLIDKQLGGEMAMSFKEFDDSNIKEKQKEYEAEIKEKWGYTDTFKEYEEKKKEAEVKGDNSFWNGDEVKAIFEEFAALINTDPNDEKVQNLVKKWQQYITKKYYTCTDEILKGLGTMYVKDERFKAYYDNIKEGLTEFVNEAIIIYCS